MTTTCTARFVTALLVASCTADASPVVEPGLTIVTRTFGADRDRDGYTVTVDSLVVGDHVVDSVIVRTNMVEMPLGDHTVHLSGVAGNCVVDADRKMVHLDESKSARVSFTIQCAPLSGTSVLVGAGDIARCRLLSDDATADLLDDIDGTVFTTGDNVYESGSAREYADCYDPTWGRHKERTRPAPGNHDYRTRDARGYFDYFGAAAGSRDRGYYSYDLGSWHVVVLNSNVRRGVSSPQVRWLRDDLAASAATCTVAYWHSPRFSSGSRHGNNESMSAVWDVLYAAGVEIVVNGHDHNYERFAPQAPDASYDPNGIRQFVVGTGGTRLRPMGKVQPNSEVRNAETHGVLQLTLRDGGYDWDFVPVAGGTFTDSGSGVCH